MQWATADLGIALLRLGRVDEAAEYFTRADAAGDQVGDDAAPFAHLRAGDMASDRGQYAAALALLVQACDGFQRLEVAVPTGLALAGSPPPTELLARAAAVRDTHDRHFPECDIARTSGCVVRS